MNTVSDLAARAVSFITVIQDEFVDMRSANKEHSRIEFAAIFSPKVMVPLARKIAGENGVALPDALLEMEFRENWDAGTEARASFRTGISALPDDNAANRMPTLFQERAVELVYVSSGLPRFRAAAAYALGLSIQLAAWIHQFQYSFTGRLQTSGSLPTPQVWREQISSILYTDPGNRIKLALAMEYIPIPIVLAIGGKTWKVREQRIFQIWAGQDELLQELLGKTDAKQHLSLWASVTDDDPGTPDVPALLTDDILLADRLVLQDVPLPFDLVYKYELCEVRDNRELRHLDRAITVPSFRSGENLSPGTPGRAGGGSAGGPGNNGRGSGTPPPGDSYIRSGDPQQLAAQMELTGLAFSGGGIRSATFNLGILQALARQGLVARVDYLSTVSGGGYIGSWLAAWIKREGSVQKVADRLNPDKSPDPFAEEVRPIRWLRMYSNYLAPSAGLMSADAWTIGATWLRNTLLNQSILLLLFLSLLLILRGVFEFWTLREFWTSDPGINSAYLIGAISLTAVSILIGLSMQVYERDHHAIIADRDKITKRITHAIKISAMIGALIVSAGFYTRPEFAQFGLERTKEKILYLRPAAGVILFALILIGYVGKYYRCIKAGTGSMATAHFALLASSFFATVVSVLSLVGVWELLQLIQLRDLYGHPFLFFDERRDTLSQLWKGLAFMIGPPLILLTFGITVIARMALLGRYFPDDRREWWGRIGAELARQSVLFMLFAGSSLIGLQFVEMAIESHESWWTGPATIGGWAALVGATVKAGFSDKTSGSAKDKSGGALVNILSAAGPYLFALGLLIFLPALLIPLLKLRIRYYSDWMQFVQCFVLGGVLGVIAYGVAWRVGVNEFSMHHFYRNRLVRAYLGATRRRTDRNKTANPYTNFDPKDDVKLATLRKMHGYKGPYPILNTALNASQASSLDRQDRKAESFTFSPLYCGFDFSMTRASADVIAKSYDYGYRFTGRYAYGDNGPGIGTAMAISGAAVNPNQGYHSSPGISFLLTVFNVQMGWWMGNPRKSTWRSADPPNGLAYILANLAGRSSTRDKYVCLSDGGHFDNMGLYELVRRRCRFIILGDGEQDDQFSCEGLANAIRRCRIDFGAEIVIDISQITHRDDKNHSKKRYALGEIHYAGDDGPPGRLLYIKSSVHGDEPVDVLEYAQKNPTFPHQTTADQFFDEEQFESYRRLGLHIADEALTDPRVRRALQIRRLHYYVVVYPGSHQRPQAGIKYRISRRWT